MRTFQHIVPALAALVVMLACVGCGAGFSVRRVDRSVALREGTTLCVLPASAARGKAGDAEAPRSDEGLTHALGSALAEEAGDRFEVATGSPTTGDIGVRTRVRARAEHDGVVHALVRVELVRYDGRVIDAIDLGASYLAGDGETDALAENVAARLVEHLRRR